MRYYIIYSMMVPILFSEFFFSFGASGLALGATWDC